jgi:thiol-disulfide isomerase/thioredoxin
MPAYRNNKVFPLLLIAVVVLICLSGFFVYRIFSQKTLVEFYMFDNCGGCNVQNPCKPCKIFLDLINKYKRALAEGGLLEKTDFRPYNIYMDNDAAAYRKNISAIGLEEIPSLPAAVIGGRLISGEAAIDENLIPAVKARRRFIPLLKQFLGFSGRGKVKMGIYDEKTVVDFSLPYCEDCKKTDAFLESLPGITVIKIDPSDAKGRALYEKYCEAYGVPVNDYAAPRLFVQKSSFTGYQETVKSLEAVLAGNTGTIKIDPE